MDWWDMGGNWKSRALEWTDWEDRDTSGLFSLCWLRESLSVDFVGCRLSLPVGFQVPEVLLLWPKRDKRRLPTSKSCSAAKVLFLQVEDKGD